MASLSYTPLTSNTLLRFGENVLDRNDDSYSSPIDITAIFEDGIDIGGQVFSEIYLNNNGNVTFGSGLSTYTPGVIGGTTGLNIIAPFWADVDTRADVPDVPDGVFWDIKEGRDSIVFTWNQVGYYNSQINKLDTFQLELMDRGLGDVEIIFRYQSVNWTTGGASGGVDGLGGTIARAGFSLGGLYFELPASGDQTGMLELETQSGNLGVSGVWQFLLRDGTPSGFGTTDPDTYTGTMNRDIWFGLEGNDTASGRGRGDVIYGNAGDDVLYGGAGADRLYGEAGADSLYGGTENDLLDGGEGDDMLTGGGGRDTAAFQSGSLQQMVVRLDLGTATGMGSDTLVSIESASTGAGADLLVGNDLNNLLSGGAGADTLRGGDGADRLIGGLGRDRLVGGADADRFVFQRGGGTDRVADFQDGLDRFEIGTGANSFADITVADDGVNVRISFADAVIIVENRLHTLINASDFVFV
jgi:Ca2+-binding RTX toxin-like protein